MMKALPAATAAGTLAPPEKETLEASAPTIGMPARWHLLRSAAPNRKSDDCRLSLVCVPKPTGRKVPEPAFVAGCTRTLWRPPSRSEVRKSSGAKARKGGGHPFALRSAGLADGPPRGNARVPEGGSDGRRSPAGMIETVGSVARPIGRKTIARPSMRFDMTFLAHALHVIFLFALIAVTIPMMNVGGLATTSAAIGFERRALWVTIADTLDAAPD